MFDSKFFRAILWFVLILTAVALVSLVVNLIRKELFDFLGGIFLIIFAVILLMFAGLLLKEMKELNNGFINEVCHLNLASLHKDELAK